MEKSPTEQSIEHTDGQQNTGNHKVPGAPDAKGANRVGGTRAGVENVEPNRDSREESIETGTDVDRVSGLDQHDASTKHVDNSRERHPERDEHGRL